MSSFGTALRVTLFGESHGPAVGALLTGMPPGIAYDAPFVASQLARRRPGQSAVTTQRKETDEIEILSGLFEGKTTGAPLLLLARNEDKDSSKYDPARPRPGHADLAGHLKFFGQNDWRGSGHFGGRLTFGLVASGALARLALRRFGVEFVAYTEEIGGMRLTTDPPFGEAAARAEKNEVRCPDTALADKMREAILKTRTKGDSLGGVVRCRIRNIPSGLGGYHQESFESRMGSVMFGIPAVKGVGFGLGFELARQKGSESNDPIGFVKGSPQALSARQGGTVGGVTDGSEVSFAVAFKPTSSILTAQSTVNLKSGKPDELTIQGRHDPCIVPRAVPVVENAAALVVLDLLLARLGEEAFQKKGGTG